MSTITLSERITKAKAKRGLSYREIAHAASVPKSTIIDWAHGRYTPKANDARLQTLAVVLDLPKVAVTKPV